MDIDDEERIHVTHLNIRPSISMLVLQLIFLDLVAAAVITFSYFAILLYPVIADMILRSYLGLFLIVLVFIVQICLSSWAVLQWINDYYELTPKLLVHRKGVIWRKIEKYPMEHIRYVTINYGLLGRLLNFGTITLYDMRRIRYTELYLIHNPNKYLEVLEKLDPSIDVVEDVIRGGASEEFDEID